MVGYERVPAALTMVFLSYPRFAGGPGGSKQLLHVGSSQQGIWEYRTGGGGGGETGGEECETSAAVR